MGTWGLAGAYGPVTPELARETLEAAFEAGVTAVDVAPLWGDTEALAGDVIGDREIRVITRGGALLEDGVVHHRFDADSLRADVDRSRERLGRDVLDVWLLHDPPEEALGGSDDPLATAAKLVADGAVRHWGVSTTQQEVAERALAAGAKAICIPHHLFASDLFADLQESLEDAGAGVLARSPLCHGLLTGRWTEYRRFAEDDHRRQRWSPQALAIRVRQVAQIRFLVKEQVRSLTAAALRFALDSSVVTTAIVGARRPAQVRDLGSLVGDPPYMDHADAMRLQQVLAAAGV